MLEVFFVLGGWDAEANEPLNALEVGVVPLGRAATPLEARRLKDREPHLIDLYGPGCVVVLDAEATRELAQNVVVDIDAEVAIKYAMAN